MTLVETYEGKSLVPGQSADNDKTRQAMLKKAGLTAMVTETTDHRELDYPVLRQDQFRDVCEVFPTSYLYGMRSIQSLNGFAHERGIQRLDGGVGFRANEFQLWSDYNYKEGIPTGLLPLIHQLQREKTFRTLEIRTPEYVYARKTSFAADPLLLGILKTGARALIARWGREEFITMEEISFIAELRRKNFDGYSMWACIWAGSRRRRLYKRYPQYAGYFEGESGTRPR